MAAIFDTLKYAKGAIEAGTPREQAEYQADQLSHLVNDSLVTKSDLLATKNELLNEMLSIKNELSNEMLKLELKLSGLIVKSNIALGSVLIVIMTLFKFMK